VKTWLVRAAAVAGASIAAWVLHVLLAPLGYGWVVWVLAAVVGGFLTLELSLRWRKRAGERADWARWKAALHDPRARRRAIDELRRAGDRARRLGPRFAVRQARLAVARAELELADGQAERAIATLSKLDVSRLEPAQAVVVRLARAQAYLHDGDVDGAAATLSPFDGSPPSDPALAASVTIARGQVALEEGRADEAAEAAAQVVVVAEPHDELWDEAQALAGCCAAARGEDPAPILDAIRAPGRRRLAALGSARLRRLLEDG